MQATDEQLRIQYDLTRDDYTAAVRYATQRLMQSVNWGWFMHALTLLAGICGVIIGYGYLELVQGYHGEALWGWSVGVAFLAIWTLTVWQQRLRAKRVFSAMVADDGAVLGPQDLTVTPEALVHRHRSATTHLAWLTLKAIEEKENNVLIFIDNSAFYAVPYKAFAGADERAAWVNLLRARSGAAPADARAIRVSESPSSAAPPVAASVLSSDGPAAAIGLLRNFRNGIRIAMLQRVKREELVATPEAFAALVLLNLVVLLILNFATVGANGQFNYHELPRSLMTVPLVLLFGLFVARMNKDPGAMLALAVSLMAAATVIKVVMGPLGLLMQHQAVPVAEQIWRYVYYLSYAWWAVVIAVAVLRMTPADSRRRLGSVTAGLVLLVVPSWFIPQGYLWMPAYDSDADAQNRSRSAFWALAEEKGFYAQQDALARALAGLQPERPGVADLYVITAGLYAREDVFMKEVKVIDALFRERFDADGRTLALINNPKTLQEHPVASLTSLSASLRHVGKLMNPEEDMLVLYVSSHGSETHNLSVEFWPLRLNSIDPPALKRAIDESGIKWKVIVVSACYSGGFIDPLKDDHTLIIAASSATKRSFGCGNDSDSTYLAKALFDEELRKTYSFEAAFENARKSIEQRERGQNFVPSEPQIYVGAAVRDKLKQIEQRLAARTSAPSR